MNGMGARFIALAITLCCTACGITVKEYKLPNLNGMTVRVHVRNASYEAGTAFIFKSAVETSLIRRGAVAVDKDEEYELDIHVRSIEAKPASTGRDDIATNYLLTLKGSFRVTAVKGEPRKVVATDEFSPVLTYSVAGIDQTEINRQLVIEQAAREIAEGIADRMAMLRK